MQPPPGVPPIGSLTLIVTQPLFILIISLPQVDVSGFEAEMEDQRQRSKTSREEIDLTAQAGLAELASSVEATTFVGYTELASRGSVIALLVEGLQVKSASAGKVAAGRGLSESQCLLRLVYSSGFGAGLRYIVGLFSQINQLFGHSFGNQML